MWAHRCRPPNARRARAAKVETSGTPKDAAGSKAPGKEGAASRPRWCACALPRRADVTRHAESKVCQLAIGSNRVVLSRRPVLQLCTGRTAQDRVQTIQPHPSDPCILRERCQLFTFCIFMIFAFTHVYLFSAKKKIPKVLYIFLLIWYI